MKQFTARKYVVIFLSIVVLVVLGIWLFFVHSSAKAYIGPKAVLTSPKPSVILQINNALLILPPKIPSGIQFNLHISALTMTDAKGNVTYSRKYPTVQFMAVKSGNKWIVIAHNAGKTLTLPNIIIAKKYNLPAGWYSSK